MALFSRRKRAESDDATPEPTEAVATDETTEPEAVAEHVPSVSISVSSFEGLGAPVTGTAPVIDELRLPLAPADPPADRESVEGIEDNAVLRDALARLGDDPTSEEMLGVVRQLLQGHLYLRVQGNVEELLAAGQDLQLGVVNDGGSNFMLAFSSGRALSEAVQADGDTNTSAFGQPVWVILNQLLAGDFAGLILDNLSAPARLVVPRDLIERVVEEGQPGFTVKSLVAGERTEESVAALLQELTTARLWVAVGQAGEVDGEPQYGVAEARTEDGQRFLQLFTHPLEIVALGRDEQPAPFDLDGLRAAFDPESGIDGVLIDPAGPTAQIPAEALRPVLAQAASDQTDGD